MCLRACMPACLRKRGVAVAKLPICCLLRRGSAAALPEQLMAGLAGCGSHLTCIHAGVVQEDAVDGHGALKVDKAVAINKIGHGEHRSSGQSGSQGDHGSWIIRPFFYI